MAALLLVVAMVLSIGMRGNEAQLHLDGIVIVKKMPLDGTRVIVVDRDGPSTVISKDLNHFSLPLSLDRTYLLSFEREGCVTKQLLFDTRVPGSYMADAPFSFPFQVTLEPPPTDAPFTYAGPVGFVRFYENIHDFGYDTDYRIARDAALTERLEQVRQEQLATAVMTPTLKAAPLPEPVPDPDAPKGAFEELAPTLPDVPPLVHNTGDATTRTTLTVASIKQEAVIPAPVPAPKPLVTPVAATKPSPAGTVPVVDEKGVHDVSMQQTSVVDDRSREEQLIVEPRQVTTIIRLMDHGHTTVYRRVAHAYGAVFFFRNGESCSERTFELARAH